MFLKELINMNLILNYPWMYVFSFTASTDNNIEIRNFPSGRKLVCTQWKANATSCSHFHILQAFLGELLKGTPWLGGQTYMLSRLRKTRNVFHYRESYSAKWSHTLLNIPFFDFRLFPCMLLENYSKYVMGKILYFP